MIKLNNKPILLLQPETSLNHQTVESTQGEHIDQLVKKVSETSGLVSTHLAPLQAVAQTQNCIIGIRPVDRLATDLIAAGYPTKGFHIKGKSASWGAQAGLICTDQRFSKLENKSTEQIKKYNRLIEQCIAEQHAESVPLAVTYDRLHTLCQLKAIDSLSLENEDGVIQFTATAPSLQTYQFEAKWDAGYQRYLVSYHGKQLQVLSPKQSTLPLTADYDLLLIGPCLEDFGVKDNLPIQDVAHEVFLRRFSQYRRTSTDSALFQYYKDPLNFYKNEDKEIGNASLRVREMIPLINQALVGDGEKVVHHSIDATNPVSELEANFPATFALPRKIGHFDPLCMINTKEELVELVKAAKAEGYHIKTNPLWEKELPQVRRPSFDQAQRKFSLNK
ncbi:anthrax toxin-like adenylyl cyclase domain-containing protein [Providencia stuartii]|uniref:anthrax toxin-like adenylyl cyclase domain-containing protein n=1 Tax=Providencia stuartii TaxID=588 RepID=UPI00300BFE43